MNDVKVLLLSVSQWDFEDEKTRERRKGTTVFVCHLDDVKKENVTGMKPVKYTLEYDAYSKMKDLELPAYALGQFVFDFSKGKLVPFGFEAIAPIEMGILNA